MRENSTMEFGVPFTNDEPTFKMLAMRNYAMRKREYLRADGLKDLREDQVISSALPMEYRRKKYWQVLWSNESEWIKTAVGATMAVDGASKASFGIQEILLRDGVVGEILLVHKRWQWYYRIPANIFREFSMTRKGDRRVFQVTWEGAIRSKDTPWPISISNYRRQREPLVEIKIQMKALEIAALRQATDVEVDAEAIATAAREFLRLKRLRELKSASGKVELVSN